MGKVESGSVREGDNLLVMPNRVIPPNHFPPSSNLYVLNSWLLLDKIGGLHSSAGPS